VTVTMPGSPSLTAALRVVSIGWVCDNYDIRISTSNFSRVIPDTCMWSRKKFAWRKAGDRRHHCNYAE